MLNPRKDLFQLPSEVTYLNCAYMSPMLKSVEMAGIEGIRMKRAPFYITKDEFFEIPYRVRTEFAKTIHSKEARRISLIPSVSYGMGIVARNLALSKGDEIIVVGEQFPSNVYPWLKLATDKGAKVRIISSPEVNQNRGKHWNEHILEAITSKTRMVSLGHVHWADGTLFDLASIRQRTLDVDALLVIDGTQSVGALPLDVEAIKPDALICAGYKWLMGPYSTGLAYLGEYFDDGEPLEENWKNRLNSHDFANLVNYQPLYQDFAVRYDVGESSNFILLPMLLEALRQINLWQPGQIQDYCRQLVHDPLEQLREYGYTVEDPDFRSSHLFGIRVPQGTDLQTLKQRFADQNIYVSIRGNAIRVSPHLYNDEKDMEHLVHTCLQLPAHSS